MSALNQAIDIKLLVNDKSVLSDLATTKLRWKILIEVSTGYERTGLDTVEKIDEIKDIAKILASNEKAFGKNKNFILFKHFAGLTNFTFDPEVYRILLFR